MRISHTEREDTPHVSYRFNLGCWKILHPSRARDYPRHACRGANEHQQPRPIQYPASQPAPSGPAAQSSGAIAIVRHPHPACPHNPGHSCRAHRCIEIGDRAGIGCRTTPGHSCRAHRSPAVYGREPCHPCRFCQIVATSLPFLAAFAAHRQQRTPPSPMNSDVEGGVRREQNQKAAKTAMFTIPVNIAGLPLPPPPSATSATSAVQFSPSSSVFLRALCGNSRGATICHRKQRRRCVRWRADMSKRGSIR